MRQNIMLQGVLIAGLVLASSSPITWVAEMKLTENDRIIILGDSITQAGDEPGGYVTMVREEIGKRTIKMVKMTAYCHGQT